MNPESETDLEQNDSSAAGSRPKRRRKLWSRMMMFARRAHLYAGLFLLPWVFLYGITGAMFSHQGLFPDVSFRPVPRAVVDETELAGFPSPDTLAKQVTSVINDAADDVTVELAKDAEAKFTNNMMFEFHHEGQRHLLHINPHDFESHVVRFPEKNPKPEKLIGNIKNIKLSPNPQEIARRSAKKMITDIGYSVNHPKPHGWTKLNFMANVDGQPARVTYVLKDGHVDVTAYDGQPGMTARGFLMRLHTTHGQSPSWTARMVWVVFADVMAIAMVSWGVTGLLMWWQIKRVRVIGGVVMICSVLVAAIMFFAVQHFYAANTL